MTDPTTPIRQDAGTGGADVHNPDIDILRARVSELSELCDTLTTEKAEAIRQAEALAVQVAELARDKAGLVEKLGDLTGERDYLRQALAAALTRPLHLPEKAESLDGEERRSWWHRLFGKP